MGLNKLSLQNDHLQCMGCAVYCNNGNCDMLSENNYINAGEVHSGPFNDTISRM